MQLTHNRWTITDWIHIDQPIWEVVESQENIEVHLLARNHRHLQQTAREWGASTLPPLTTIRENYGINPHTEEILDGTFANAYDLTPEMKAFFDALQRTPATD